MIRDDADRHIVLFGGAVDRGCFLTDPVQDSPDGIHLEHTPDLLDNGRYTFQARARIDILFFQGLVAAVLQLVELGKDQIPVFDITVALTAHLAVRTAAAIGLSSVKEEFGAGPAGSGSMLPEVFLIEAGNAVSRHPCAYPVVISFIILHMNRDMDTL